MWYISHNQWTNIDILLSPKVHALVRFPWFLPLVFSVPESHLGYHLTFSCHVSTGLLLWKLHRFSLFLMNLTVLITEEVFCGMPPTEICLMIFLMIRKWIWVLVSKTTEANTHPSLQIRSTYYPHELWRLLLPSPTWLR